MNRNYTKLTDNEQELIQLLIDGELFYSGIHEDKVYACISSKALRLGLISYLGVKTFVFYVFLLAHYNKISGDSFPTYNTIRNACKIGTESIQESIRKLIDIGLISLRTGENGNYIYHLHDIKLAKLSPETYEEDTDEDDISDEEQRKLLDEMVNYSSKYDEKNDPLDGIL